MKEFVQYHFYPPSSSFTTLVDVVTAAILTQWRLREGKLEELLGGLAAII